MGGGGGGCILALMRLCDSFALTVIAEGVGVLAVIEFM